MDHGDKEDAQDQEVRSSKRMQASRNRAMSW
jgi:hypothetical protein